jgi:DNA-binding IclR family transcriptional regulator
VTVKELARELSTSVSTCYHLIGILLDEGYIERLPHRAGYCLGPAVGALAQRTHWSSAAAAIEPMLHELARLADRPAYFGILSASDDLVVATVRSPPGSPPIRVPEGFRGPSHALALGKVLIAGGGSAAINRYIEHHELRAFTSRTIIDPVRLKAHLGDVRARGYATDFEEFSKNVVCVAVPVCDVEGPAVGSVALTADASTSTDELKRLVRLARRSALQVAAVLRREGHPLRFEPVPG